MAEISKPVNFRTQELEDYYHKNSDLTTFRESLTADAYESYPVGGDPVSDTAALLKTELNALDGRISKYASVAMDGVEGKNVGDFPYDSEAALKREMLEEILGMMTLRKETKNYITQAFADSFKLLQSFDKFTTAAAGVYSTSLVFPKGLSQYSATVNGITIQKWFTVGKSVTATADGFFIAGRPDDEGVDYDDTNILAWNAPNTIYGMVPDKNNRNADGETSTSGTNPKAYRLNKWKVGDYVMNSSGEVYQCTTEYDNWHNSAEKGEDVPLTNASYWKRVYPSALTNFINVPPGEEMWGSDGCLTAYGIGKLFGKVDEWGAEANVGYSVYNAYKKLIEDCFAAGNELKKDPLDAVTTKAVDTSLVTAITPRMIGDVLYTHVTTVPQKDSSGKPVTENGKTVMKTYLIAQQNPTAQGLQTYRATKENEKVTYDGNTESTVVGNKPAFDRFVHMAGSSPDFAAGSGQLEGLYYLEVEGNVEKSNYLEPIGLAASETTKRPLTMMEYVYYWNEARIRVFRTQLNQKQAVSEEIRADLALATQAKQDLERVKADKGAPTRFLQFFQATKKSLSFKGTPDNTDKGYDTYVSTLQAHIDTLNTRSQDAMQDYQAVLNRFNNAYEVMAKLQEKMDSLIKSQLRNMS